VSTSLPKPPGADLGRTVGPDEDLRRMTPIYVAVILVEVVVLVGLWVFQTWFSS
jgi:hypothetical protein